MVDRGRYKNDEISKYDVYFRIAGHVTMLYIFITKTIQMILRLFMLLPTHPELQVFLDLGPRYATVWNLMIQMTYATIALASDLSEVLKKEHLISKKLRKFRYSMFSGLFYPLGMTVPLVFWPIYIYDRELVFPRKVDLFLSFFDNFTYHFLIAVYALYELIFIPRNSIKDERTFRYVLWFCVLFVFSFYFTKYVDIGIWMYGVCDVLEGTIGFYLMLSLPWIYAFFFYLTQRRTQEAVWRYREKWQNDVKCTQ